MNEDARKVILQHFCTRRHLSQDRMSPALIDMVCATTAPYLLMIECLDRLDPNDPTGGLLLKLVNRTYDTAAASLALIAIGHLREAEVLARSVLESGATTTFIVQQNPPVRLVQFFRDYLRQEREQNRKWKNDLEGAPATIQADHAARIDQKNASLDHYDQLIDGYIKHSAIPLAAGAQFPGLIDRFTELGRRLEYRTVYMAMCSQAHHDAEDVLNHFLANSIVGDDDLGERTERETDIFSIFMVLFGLRWCVQAIRAVCTWLKFPTAMTESLKSQQRIVQELEIVASHIGTGDLPKAWTIP